MFRKFRLPFVVVFGMGLLLLAGCTGGGQITTQAQFIQTLQSDARFKVSFTRLDSHRVPPFCSMQVLLNEGVKSLEDALGVNSNQLRKWGKLNTYFSRDGSRIDEYAFDVPMSYCTPPSGTAPAQNPVPETGPMGEIIALLLALLAGSILILGRKRLSLAG